MTSTRPFKVIAHNLRTDYKGVLDFGTLEEAKASYGRLYDAITSHNRVTLDDEQLEISLSIVEEVVTLREAA